MKNHILTIVIAAAVALGVAWGVGPHGGASHEGDAQPARESAYDRVMRTGVLRCGYFVWPPHFTVDLKTGEKGGLYYDIVEELGRTLGVKIEWAHEYTLGTQIEALKTGKVDALCADGPWTRSALPYLDYSEPYYYIPGFLYGKKGNPKIKPGMDWGAFDDPSYSFTALDGDGSHELVTQHFPKISWLSMPTNADPSLLVQNILSGKADLMWNDALTIAALPKDQQDQLVNLNPNRPIGAFPFVVSLEKGQGDLRQMLDQGIDVMRNMGILEKIMGRYDFPAGSVYLPAPTFRPVTVK